MPSFFIPKRYAPTQARVLGFISAGIPLDPSPFRRRQRLPIPVPFRRHGMFAVQVDGDSMTLPDGNGIPHGAYVLVDSRDPFSGYGHAYAFERADGTLVVKRLRLLGGRPAMYSDNDAYPPVPVSSRTLRRGRVYAYSLDGHTWHSVGYQPWTA